MQTGQAKWISKTWKIAKRFFIVIIVIYGILFAINRKYPKQFYDCERDTQYLHGGVQTYDGQKYGIVLCGTGGDENFMGDEIRLQVLSEKGELLAQRRFTVDWITNFPRELKYGPDYVTYYDASQQTHFEHRISMPPTRWDWVRARLPLLS
ncbi:hypothetical protein AB1286_22810 [Trinickia sp. NRRL B-1857]|uniref:hypothetical protein n=1 Tax=Trinickia sp. NRRL B-1857 TaxID=3162879 RepID=UPI003D2B4888